MEKGSPYDQMLDWFRMRQRSLAGGRKWSGLTVTGSESTGKITDYTPDSALVLDTGSGEPVHYKFARKVSYVDKDGQTIQTPALTKNLRVKVHYLKQGGDMIVDKVTLTE